MSNVLIIGCELRRKNITFLRHLFHHFSPLRHGVIPMSAPGMTAQDAANGKPQSFQGTVLLNGLHSILRTRGRKAARGGSERGDKLLVKADGEDEQAGEHSVILWARWVVPDGVALQRGGAS